MVESSAPHPSISKQLDKLDKVFTGKKLETDECNMGDLSRTLTKMPYRQEPETIGHVMDKLFKIAGDKISNESDKTVLEGLKKMVLLANQDMVIPKPRFLDAMFFPSENNVDKLCAYISKAKRSL
jgi:hypothetical protein